MCYKHLFVDPAVDEVALVVADLLSLEPVSDFSVGRIDRVRSVADVTSSLDAEVSTDGSRGGLEWIGCSEHVASLLDDVQSLPYHGNHGSGSHVLDKGGEEWLVLEVLVVDLNKQNQ